jgi:hypothetical protein
MDVVWKIIVGIIIHVNHILQVFILFLPKEAVNFSLGMDPTSNKKIVIVLVMYRNVHIIGRQNFAPFLGKVIVAKYVTIIREVTEEVLK